MDAAPLRVTLADEASTARLGETLALALRRGDVVHLRGDLGAGKTALARSLLRSAAGDPLLEVPSPTFTLVQTYENLPFGTALHADLYRIASPDELDELGLEEGAAQGVVLVEWPERGGEALVPATLTLDLAAAPGDGRTATIDGTSHAMARLRRSLRVRAFLDAHGHAGSQRRHLTGDASSRAYETLHGADPGSGSAAGAGAPAPILMNAPAQPDGPPIRDGRPYSRIAHLAEDVSAFVALADRLAQAGMRVPAIAARDLDAGLLVIENLGAGSVLDAAGRPVAERCLACMDALARLHGVPVERFEGEHRLDAAHAHTVPAYDRQAMTIEVELLADWYAPHRLGRALTQGERAAFDAIWSELVATVACRRETLVLRDFHSPNIVWDARASGTDRVGLIDFQDALIGPCAYDVASAAFDARVDMPPELSSAMVTRYLSVRGDALDRAAFERDLAVMSAQRATKILGIFVRLSRRDGKHGYLAHLPRMERILNVALAHPILSDYRSFVEGLLRG